MGMGAKQFAQPGGGNTGAPRQRRSIGELGGVELEFPPRATHPRAADFSS